MVGSINGPSTNINNRNNQIRGANQSVKLPKVQANSSNSIPGSQSKQLPDINSNTVKRMTPG